ncbi:MAG TPA: hypothetical protein VMU26_09320 [Candidatus Polarisedimenticolia bacterium]|nr:hypothetical protein [Candidatus Polarisedimenticolia bacterium]
MNESRCFVQIRKRRVLLAMSALLLGLFILHFTVYGQDKSSFPYGFDAVQAAPKSHKVIFENAFVRVLEVSVSPNTTVPMHHHRWPSLLVNWDAGGRSPHVRYHSADASVKDIPSTQVPPHPGTWAVSWMKPEPMHSVDILDAPVAHPDLRIEIKCLP